MTLEEKDAYISEHLMKLQPDTLRFMVADLTAEVTRLEAAIASAKIAGMESAAEIADEWISPVAAAIREQVAKLKGGE